MEIMLEETAHRDNEATVGMAEDVFELARGRPGVDPDHHSPEHHDGQIGDDPFGPVTHQDRHVVAAAYAERMQSARGTTDLVAQLTIRVALARSHQSFALGEASRELVDQVRDSAAFRHHWASRRTMREASWQPTIASISRAMLCARASSRRRASVACVRLRTPAASSGSSSARREAAR